MMHGAFNLAGIRVCFQTRNGTRPALYCHREPQIIAQYFQPIREEKASDPGESY